MAPLRGLELPNSPRDLLNADYRCTRKKAYFSSFYVILRHFTSFLRHFYVILRHFRQFLESRAITFSLYFILLELIS